MSFSTVTVPANISFVPVDTRVVRKVLYLPTVSTNAGRYLSFKDYYGTASNSSFTISTTGTDLLDDYNPRYTFSNAWGSLSFVSDGIRSWRMLNLYNGDLTPAAPSGFLPTQIAGLQLWLDASDMTTFTLSGSNISVWRDKSSNAYSVSQATPSLQPILTANAQNSLPGIQFATSTYLLTAGSNIPNFTTGPQTSIFYAARNASANSGWNIINTLWFNGTARYHFSFNYGGTPGTTLFMNGGFVANVTTTVTPPNSNTIIGFTASATSVTINTNSSSNVYTGVSLPNANNSTYFILGDNRNDSGVAGNIMIFETVGYNRQVTTLERQQIEGYLAWKWGLQGNLPANHPYKNGPP